MLSRRHCHQSGFSLTELMIGGAIGLTILAGAVVLYGSMVRASSTTLRQARLAAELRGAMDLIVGDLRRAGYWAGEPDTDPPIHNPFTTAENDLTVDTARGEAPDSCITFAYDRDRDKQVGVGAKGQRNSFSDHDNVEQYGFRLHDGAVESRISGSGPGCNQGSWQDLTSSTIEITALRFSIRRHIVNLSRPGQDCMPGEFCQTGRHVEITLSGHIADRQQIQQTLHDSVQIRNDQLGQISG